MNKQATVELGDITKIDTQAIVNAANSSLLGGGGVDGAIHRAGGKKIIEECREIRRRQGECAPGEAVITSGGELPAKFVTHAVGPIWKDGQQHEKETLSNAYRNSLRLAADRGIETLAFPNISTGIYGFPKKLAAEIAITTVFDFMASQSSLESVVFVCFDQDNYAIYQKTLDSK